MSTKSLVWSLPLIGRDKSTRPIVLAPGRRIPAVASRRHRSRFTAWPHNLSHYVTGFLLLSIGVLLVAYVFGINQSAAKGYEITKQRNKLNALMEENKKLMVRTAEVGSILQIQDEAAANNLVQITNQEYLQITQLSQR